MYPDRWFAPKWFEEDWFPDTATGGAAAPPAVGMSAADFLLVDEGPANDEHVGRRRKQMPLWLRTHSYGPRWG